MRNNLHAQAALLLGTTLMAMAWLADPQRRRNERGDVPGWVLVTIMSAGLVMVVWKVADGKLDAMLSNALDKVKGGP